MLKTPMPILPSAGNPPNPLPGVFVSVLFPVGEAALGTDDAFLEAVLLPSPTPPVAANDKDYSVNSDEYYLVTELLDDVAWVALHRPRLGARGPVGEVRAQSGDIRWLFWASHWWAGGGAQV